MKKVKLFLRYIESGCVAAWVADFEYRGVHKIVAGAEIYFRRLEAINEMLESIMGHLKEEVNLFVEVNAHPDVFYVLLNKTHEKVVMLSSTNECSIACAEMLDRVVAEANELSMFRGLLNQVINCFGVGEDKLLFESRGIKIGFNLKGYEEEQLMLL